MTQARTILLGSALLGSAIAAVMIVLFAVGAATTGVAESPSTGPSDEASAPRIVAFSPAIAVILTDLGLADHVVGRHAFDVSLSPDVTVVGDMNGIDYERLLRLDPTHVLLERSAHPPPDRLIRLGDQRGWEIHALPLLALDDIPAAVDALADHFWNDAVDARRNALLSELDETFRPLPSAGEAGAVLALYWTNPPGAAGPGSFHHEILTQLGFTPALSEGGPYVTIDPEDILRMDPDSLLLLMPGADEGRLDELLGPLKRLNLRAVAEGRVAVINHPLANIPATSIVKAVREIRSETRAWRPLTEGGEK